MDPTDEALAAKLHLLLPHLDERQRRLLLGAVWGFKTLHPGVSWASTRLVRTR
jgi:hypothetical protein